MRPPRPQDDCEPASTNKTAATSKHHPSTWQLNAVSSKKQRFADLLSASKAGLRCTETAGQAACCSRTYPELTWAGRYVTSMTTEGRHVVVRHADTGTGTGTGVGAVGHDRGSYRAARKCCSNCVAPFISSAAYT